MDGTVDIPQVGPVQKKTLMLVVAGIGVVVAVAYYRRSHGSSATSSTTAAAGAIDPNAVDPQTGLTYGDELATGASTYTNPNPGATGSGSVSSTGAITSDTQWAQAVENDGRMAQYGDLGVVLGLYLDRQPLTSDQATEVRAAWALYGHPPSNQPIIPVTTGSTPGGGGTTGTPPATPTGLHVLPGQVSAISVGIGWNPVSGATGYRVGVRSNTNSTNQWSFQDIGAGGSTTVGGLHSKTPYEFTLQARNAAGLSGYPSAIFQKTS